MRGIQIGKKLSSWEKALTFLVWVIGDIIYLISIFIPKNNALWVFGSWMGEKYSDNSKYLFEYINENHPEIKAVWLSANTKTVDFIRHKGYRAVRTYGLMGTWLSLRAKTGVISTWMTDINIFASSRTKIVQLWHGTPIKKIGRDNKADQTGNSLSMRVSRKLFPFLGRDFSDALIMAPSEQVQDIYAGAFGSSKANIKITGYPRNDLFFVQRIEGFPFKETILELKKNHKIGIYMPTYRGEGIASSESLLPGDLNKANDDLAGIDAILLIKYHHYELYHHQKKPEELSNIIFLNDSDICGDIYPLLTLVDFLVTDYSSVIFDFLLTGKPMIFTPFDLEEYTTGDRELYYSYDEIAPGPKARDWDQLTGSIDKIINGPDEFKEARARIRSRFNLYMDGQSSRRVFEEIARSSD